MLLQDQFVRGKIFCCSSDRICISCHKPVPVGLVPFSSPIGPGAVCSVVLVPTVAPVRLKSSASSGASRHSFWSLLGVYPLLDSHEFCCDSVSAVNKETLVWLTRRLSLSLSDEITLPERGASFTLLSHGWIIQKTSCSDAPMSHRHHVFSHPFNSRQSDVK